jgi:hypothetical protein
MYRYGPRFYDPVEPYFEGPVQPTNFRGGPQRGPLSQDGGGSTVSGTMQNPQGQGGGGGMGLGQAMQTGGLLSKFLGGPTATSYMDPGFSSQAAQWGAPSAGGIWPETALTAGGGGGGMLGASEGGIFGTASGGPEGLLAASGNASSGGSAGMGMGGLASPGIFAALIGMGKNTEANHAGTPLGDGLLAGLGPSAAQVMEDPVGMGLPTLFGAPFLTPFFGSDEAKAASPEWSGLFGLGF